MAIEVPYSLELAAHEDAIEAVEGSTPDTTTAKMKIFLGNGVNPMRPQVFVGTLKSVYRHMMNENFKHVASNGAQVGHGHWQNASAGNIAIDSGVANIEDDEVAISIAGNFETTARTHLYTETFNQLINVLLERTADGGTVAPPPDP